MSHVPPVNTVNDDDHDRYRHAVVVFPTPPPGTSVTVVRPVVIYSTNRHSLLTRYDQDKLPKANGTGGTGDCDDEEDRICVICLEPLQNDQVAALQCAHALHEKCLQAWIAKKKKPVCPVCLTDFSDEKRVIEMHISRQIQNQQEAQSRPAASLSVGTTAVECAVTVTPDSNVDNSEAK